MTRHDTQYQSTNPFQALSYVYRYGFQGQEEDGELWSGSVSYKYRVEDARLGRFFSLDPLHPQFPHNSVYAFSENRLLDGKELEGLEVFSIHGDARVSAYVTISLAAGVIFDLQGNVGLFISPGFGGGFIGGASAGVGFSVYPAMSDISQTEGWGISASRSGFFEAGISFSIDGALDQDALEYQLGLNPQKPESDQSEGGFSIYVGGGLEAGATIEATYTWIASATVQEAAVFIQENILPDQIENYKSDLKSTRDEVARSIKNTENGIVALKVEGKEKSDQFKTEANKLSGLKKMYFNLDQLDKALNDEKE